MENSVSPSSLTLAAFAYAGACLVCLLALGRIEEPLRVYGAAHSGALLLGRDPAQGLLWGVGLGSAAAALGEVVSRWTPWGRLFSRLIERILGTPHPVDAILLAILSGFGEELIFRGIALPYLGLYASACLFGIAHVIPRKGLWPFALWAGANGLALGWLAVATGGLLAPGVAHVLVNAVGLLQLSLRKRTSDRP